MSELLDSERVYLRITSKLDYANKSYLTAIGRYLDSNKRADRDTALMYREHIRKYEEILTLIKTGK